VVVGLAWGGCQGCQGLALVLEGLLSRLKALVRVLKQGVNHALEQVVLPLQGLGVLAPHGGGPC
jgi:hypothetical protein